LKDRYTKSFYRLKLKNIGAELSKKRLKLGINQTELAQQIGVRLETIQNWEHRRSIPDIYYLRRIIDFLGYDPFEDTKN
jgi:transcriptional regulator with XRE-family HTH domain